MSYNKASTATTSNTGRATSAWETFALPTLDLQKQNEAAAIPNEMNHRAARRNPATPVNDTD